MIKKIIIIKKTKKPFWIIINLTKVPLLQYILSFLYFKKIAIVLEIE
jgi:hypothetical protein